MGALLLGIGQASTVLVLVLVNWIALHSSSAAALTTRQLPTNATSTTTSTSTDLNTVDFPPGLYLGWGIDVTQLGLVDGNNILEKLATYERLLKWSGKPSPQQVVPGTTWQVPSDVDVLPPDTGVSNVILTTFDSGKDLNAALTQKGSLSGTYDFIKGTGEIDLAVAASYKEDYQYGTFAFAATQGGARLAGTRAMVDLNVLREIAKVPSWNERNPIVVRQYRSLFGKYGTHLVTSCYFGYKMTSVIEVAKRSLNVSANLEGDIKASVEGMAGSFSDQTKSSVQYQQFLTDSVNAISATGGDPELRDLLETHPNDPGINNTLSAWLASGPGSTDVVSFGVANLWDLMNDDRVPEAQQKWLDINSAFLYLANNPQTHITSCRLVINSDWGEVSLYSPNAYIQADPSVVSEPRTDVLQNKIYFINDGPVFDYTIDFQIRNDGSPIVLGLSHGWHQGEGVEGWISISVQGPDNQYRENRNLTGNPYNTVRYEGLKPNPNPSGESMNPYMSNATYSPEKVVPLPVPSQTPGTGSLVLPGTTGPDPNRVNVT